MKAAVLALTCVWSSAAAGAGTVLFAAGAWVAVDRGNVCEALSRSQRIASKDKTQATAGFSFASDRQPWGEFHVRLSRLPRGDASVRLQVGSQMFLLVSRAGWAWSRGPTQADAIMSAARSSSTMMVVSRDAQGARFSDPYLLDGAPTAIDSAAARCGLRSAGKIR